MTFNFIHSMIKDFLFRLSPLSRICCKQSSGFNLALKRFYLPGLQCNLPLFKDVNVDCINRKVETKCEASRHVKRKDHEQLLSCHPRLPHRPPTPRPQKNQKKIMKEQPFFRSMWESLGREQPYCKDLLPRFDELYYKPSDKFRAFQRTWVECPTITQRLKKICCLDDIIPPEVLKRTKKPCPVYCSFDYSRMRYICGKEIPNEAGKSMKMDWPCCTATRCPALHLRRKKRKVCTRMRTPCKCFSDRVRNVMTMRKECPAAKPLMCDVLRYTKRLMDSARTAECSGEVLVKGNENHI